MFSISFQYLTCQIKLYNFRKAAAEQTKITALPNTANIINFELRELTVPDKLSFSSEIKFFHAIRFVC